MTTNDSGACVAQVRRSCEGSKFIYSSATVPELRLGLLSGASKRQKREHFLSIRSSAWITFRRIKTAKTCKFPESAKAVGGRNVCTELKNYPFGL